MGWWLVLKSRLVALFQRRRLEAELDEELRGHVEFLTEENQRRGMSPEQARRQALLQFGGVEQTKEDYRRRRGLPGLEAVASDIKYGLRMLRKSPGFTAVAVLTLALGIGANTAVFQLLNAVRLRNLSVPDPDALAELRIVGGKRPMFINPTPYGQLTRPIWEQLRQRQQAFAALFSWSSGELDVGEGSELRRVRRLSVGGDFFAALGVRPWQGRLLGPDDEAGPCPPATAVVSHGYWQTQMGGRGLASDSRLLVGGRAIPVVGVTPPGFFGVAVGESFDVVLPLCRPQQLRADIFDLSIMGRLRSGWTLAAASAHLEGLSPDLFAATTPTGYTPAHEREYQRFRLGAYPAAAGVSRLRARYQDSLWLLLAITGLVLLIACANLANLMLARATTRQREIAVRLALGAGRRRLIQQLLVESALLAGLGAALGGALAQLLGRALVWALSADLPLETDWRVWLFTTGAAALTCGIFGVLPAVRASNAQPAGVLQASGPGATSGAGGLSLHRLLVISQIAVSLVLLFAAMLFIASFRNLLTLDPGLRLRGMTVALFDLQRAQVPPTGLAQLQAQLLGEVRALPGITGAATTTTVPLFGGSWGHRIQVGATSGESRFTWVSPGYFATLGIPLRAGRDFDRNDSQGSRRVAVVNQSFVARFLAGVNPIGQRLTTSPEPNYPATTYQIVGVIPDTKYNVIRDPTPTMAFAPAAQFPAQGPQTAIMIHSQAAPAQVIEAVRRSIAGKHPAISMSFIDFEKRMRAGLLQEQLMAALSGFFGVLALLLATVGVYGVTSYMVARRRKEIGIRIALGARAAQVVGMVARESARLVLIGVTVGAALALLCARAAGSLLFGIAAHDATTLVAAAAIMAVIAIGASLLPARRGARTSPMAALREE